MQEELDMLVPIDVDDFDDCDNASQSESEVSDSEVRRAVRPRHSIIDDDAFEVAEQSPEPEVSNKGSERPATTGDYVGMWQAKKEMAAAVRRFEEEDARDLAQARQRQIAASNRMPSERSYQRVGVVDTEDLNTLDLQKKAEDAVTKIRRVAGISKGLKGTCIRDLKDAASAITEVAEAFMRRTESEEVVKLRAQYSTLSDQMIGLERQYVEQLRTTEELREKLARIEAARGVANNCPPSAQAAAFNAPEIRTIVQEVVAQAATRWESRLDEVERRFGSRLEPPTAAEVFGDQSRLVAGLPDSQAESSGRSAARRGKKKAPVRTAPPQSRIPASRSDLSKVPARTTTNRDMASTSSTAARTQEEKAMEVVETIPQAEEGEEVIAPAVEIATTVEQEQIESAVRPSRSSRRRWEKTSIAAKRVQEAEHEAVSVASANDGDGWIRVRSRKAAKKGGRSLSEGRNNQRQAPPTAKPRARKLREPRTAAITLNLQPEAIARGVNNGALIGEAKSKIDIDALGIEIRFRTAVTGACIIQIPGEDSAKKADMLAEKMRQVLDPTLVKIARPTKSAEIRILNLDDSVVRDEIIAAVSRSGKCEAMAIQCGEVRRIGRRLGTAWVRCPIAVAKTLVSQGTLKVGWSTARVELLPERVLCCYRCQESGHAKVCCHSDVDRSNCCYRCGQSGHKAYECSAKPHCAVCEAAGRKADHRCGRKTCSMPKNKRTPAPANTSQPAGSQPPRAGVAEEGTLTRN